MDAELKAKLLDYLDTLEGAAKQGADFTAEQVPLLASFAPRIFIIEAIADLVK